MRKLFSKFAFTAALMLALTFTFSCSSDKDDGDDGANASPCPDAVIGDGTMSCGGQTYKTFEVGTQTWMAENLNYKASGSKCYGEGGKIVVSYDSITGKYTYATLSNAEIQANCDKYGRLYSWKAAMKVCPSGWHLSSGDDWDKLYKFAEGKSLRATSWEGCNGTDDVGFAALPGGIGAYTTNRFVNVGVEGYWWHSSTTKGEDGTYYTIRCYGSGSGSGWTELLASVRCVKD